MHGACSKKWSPLNGYMLTSKGSLGACRELRQLGVKLLCADIRAPGPLPDLNGMVSVSFDRKSHGPAVSIAAL